jgi:hypothetical protein
VVTEDEEGGGDGIDRSVERHVDGEREPPALGGDANGEPALAEGIADRERSLCPAEESVERALEEGTVVGRDGQRRLVDATNGVTRAGRESTDQQRGISGSFSARMPWG